MGREAAARKISGCVLLVSEYTLVNRYDKGCMALGDNQRSKASAAAQCTGSDKIIAPVKGRGRREESRSPARGQEARFTLRNAGRGSFSPIGSLPSRTSQIALPSPCRGLACTCRTKRLTIGTQWYRPTHQRQRQHHTASSCSLWRRGDSTRRRRRPSTKMRSAEASPPTSLPPSPGKPILSHPTPDTRRHARAHSR